MLMQDHYTLSNEKQVVSIGLVLFTFILKSFHLSIFSENQVVYHGLELFNPVLLVYIKTMDTLDNIDLVIISLCKR